MPLAINLLAHLVDSEGCSNVLSRWEQEKTTLISDGYDRRSNLNLSISLSLVSPRIKKIPGAQELLSLLSILPDGLSDTELIQSGLLTGNILRCKAALIRTALAYSDNQKRIKALMPIREYVYRIHPPADHLIQPLLQHFQELLELYIKFQGAQSSAAIITRTSSNYANIQNVILNGLQPGHPDLEKSIYCCCQLSDFSHYTGRGKSPLIDLIPNLVPQLSNDRLKAYFITELFGSWHYHHIPNPEILIQQALEHFDKFDDVDLKCKFHLNVSYYYSQTKGDPLMALDHCQNVLSLAISTENTRRHCEALISLAWIKQNLVSADFHRQADSLNVGAVCCMQLGDYKRSLSLANHARKLLKLCGQAQSFLDHAIMSLQAEVHTAKSEYIEAHRINTQILQETSVEQDSFGHAVALVLAADIDMSMGASKAVIQRSIDAAVLIFTTVGHGLGLAICGALEADITLQEGHMLEAQAQFRQCLKSPFGYHSAILTYCLTQLSDMTRWGADLNWMPSWPTVLLAYSLKSKQTLGIYKGLQFIGDIVLAQDDEDTAIALFTVALEGFTDMDVHRGKAECMLRLEIFARNITTTEKQWSIGTQQDHCLNDHHKSNRWKILITG
ncbi:hypothetical protein B0H14DRAFT_132904 [Mycena olivaceomarginata]|nr:hypothetical protein B0H14DRAFT_132904 [Mycena olivaceomarginata]